MEIAERKIYQLFIVLSLAAALLFPRSEIVGLKIKFYLPTHQDSGNTAVLKRAYFTCFADYLGMLIKPFIRVLVINFN